MDERDLSVLSLEELIQMLEATKFNQNGDALRGNEGVEEKSEVAGDEDAKDEETAARGIVEDEVVEVKEEEEEQAGEQSMMSPPFSLEKLEEDKKELQLITIPKSSEAKISDSLSPNRAATEKKVEEELATMEKQMKLQLF